jgi:hypothetical protein
VELLHNAQLRTRGGNIVAATTNRSRSVRYKGKRAIQRFCQHCDMWTHLRSVHCRTCGVCVVGWDHHCRVLGTCIGYHNLRWFMGFLFMMMLSASIATVLPILYLVGTVSAPSVVRGGGGGGDDIKHAGSSDFLLLLTGVGFGAYASLAGTVFLGVTCQWMSCVFCAIRGLTHFELKRQVYRGGRGASGGRGRGRGGGSVSRGHSEEEDEDLFAMKENPFDEGCLVNCCCRVQCPALWLPEQT